MIGVSVNINNATNVNTAFNTVLAGDLHYLDTCHFEDCQAQEITLENSSTLLVVHTVIFSPKILRQ